MNEAPLDAPYQHAHESTTEKIKPNLPKITPFTVPSDGVVPPWSSLPYEIVLSIFQHAMPPYPVGPVRESPSVSWIAMAATICKAFCKPALVALYERTQLKDLLGPHLLLETLEKEPRKCIIDYPSKIRSLVMDFHDTLAYTVPKQGRFDMNRLLSLIPRLQSLSLRDYNDFPPFRKPDYWGQSWSYPAHFYQTMDRSKIRLKEYHWNIKLGSFHDSEETHPLNGTVPNPTALHDIRSLSISDFEYDSYFVYQPCCRQHEGPLLRPDGEIREQVGKNFFHLLKNLSELSLTNYKLPEDPFPEASRPWLTTPRLQGSLIETYWGVFLDTIPKNLTSFSLTHTALRSDHLHGFLATGGSRLRCLTLNHNRNLNFFFLTSLRAFCPCLEELHVDLTYYSDTWARRATDPHYSDLLTADTVPEWPSTLRSLRVINMRQLTSEAAETFFKSLVDSSSRLQDLREIVIKASLNTAWRRRAEFREKWIPRLKKVFQRPWVEPRKELASEKAFRLFKESEVKGHAQNGEGSSRRSKRIQYQRDSSDDEVPVSRRRTRLHGRGSGAAQKAENDHDEDENNDVIQGLCTTVDISIDNLRPTEMRFSELDFLDAEPSGDEDWTGDRDDARGERYAW